MATINEVIDSLPDITEHEGWIAIGNNPAEEGHYTSPYIFFTKEQMLKHCRLYDTGLYTFQKIKYYTNK